MFCLLNVTDDGLRVGGLRRRWPKRVMRYLAPLDFGQQADGRIGELLELFGTVEVAAGQRQLVIGRCRAAH